MLSWAQFELTCADLKSVVSEVKDLDAKDVITHSTNLDALMNPKFDAIAAANKDEKQLKSTEAWMEYIAKVGVML